MDDMIVTGGDKARVVPMMESYIDNIKIHYANQGTEVVAQKIKEANLSVYQRNKPLYVIGGVAVLFCLCVGVYKLSKVISSVVS